MIIDDALNMAYSYAATICQDSELCKVSQEFNGLAGETERTYITKSTTITSYSDIQNLLSKLNEKESVRKSKGVYYTPYDVVRFIVINSVKSAYGKLTPENIRREDIDAVPYKSFAAKKTVFDPTCGAGEYLLAAFIKGASEKNEIEIIEPDKLNIAPCKGCGVCQCSKGCVDKDDTNPTIDKIAAADMILFATPVYWWGMSAQLKLVIDKCYCRGLQLKNKKVGTIVVGGSPVDSIQYELIDKQFDCMAKYLSWDMLFNKSYYATARDELEKNKNSMNELEGIGKNL